MPRGGYRGGKPPTKSFTGEPAKLVSFRLAPETIVQLEAIAAAYACTRTALIERLIANAPPNPSMMRPDAELDAMRTAFAASQAGRQKLSMQLAEATERELSYQAEIHDLRDRITKHEKGGPTWAHGVLHLPGDAGPDEVARAFRELSKRFHPDLNRDDPAASRYFKDLVTARDVLAGVQGRPSDLPE